MTSGRRDRQLLEQRAVALAAPAEAGAQGPTLEIVTVSVAGREYALETRHVRQVLPNTRLCRLPAEGGELLGLTPVKGAAVPVADLASLLGIGSPDTARPFVLLLDGTHPPVGLLVDEVVSFARLARAAVRPSVGAAEPARAVEQGVTADGLILLDTDLLLGDHRLSRPARTQRPAVLSQHQGEPCDR